LLVLVTVGIYGFVYWWQISKEIDAHEQRRRAHPRVAFGILLFVLGLATMITGIGIGTNGNPSAGAELDATGTTTMALGIITAFIGILLLWSGYWQIWKSIQNHELRTGHPKPLNPAQQLFLTVMPGLRLLTIWIALYRTQARLNLMWKSPALD